MSSGWPRWPRTSVEWLHAIRCALALCAVLSVFAYALAPIFHHVETMGVHDWDQMESHRYLVKKTISTFHQFPFWNPYACGGHPAWGGIESDTIVVSPFLPVYLLAPLGLALRVETALTTLWGIAGAWILARRYTRSLALCALVAIVWGLNGRWALQTTVGRGWHLQYAWMPWVFYFFDRAAWMPAGAARQDRRLDVVLVGICLAMMVYMGAIYPLPHTVVALSIYAIAIAIGLRSTRPLKILAVSGALGIGLASPKLLPIVETLRRFPRITASNEVLDLGSLIDLLTDPAHQDDPWWYQGKVEGQWHEWGMYLGWAALTVVVVGALLARGRREQGLKWTGVAMLVLSLGRFHPRAPWPLLHQLPVFASQHVPSRWLYPALLPLACAMASGGERLMKRLDPWGRARIALDIVLVAAVAWIGFGMEKVARGPLLIAFRIPPPAVAESTGAFVTRQNMPDDVAYERGVWAPPSLPAEMLNFGTIDCSTFPELENRGGKSINRRGRGLGARGIGDPEYRGEAYVDGGAGTARITSWTPNAVEVHVDDARPGERVILNQNWDPGWSADGEAALNVNDAVGAQVTASSQTIRFRYRPRWFAPGAGLFVLAAGAIAVAARRSMRLRSRSA